jgi:hypothetical protein
VTEHLTQTQNWDAGSFHVHTQAYATIPDPGGGGETIGVTANTQMWTDLLLEGFHATVTVKLVAGSSVVWQASQRFGVNGKWIPGAPSSLSLAWLIDWLPWREPLAGANAIQISTIRA